MADSQDRNSPAPDSALHELVARLRQSLLALGETAGGRQGAALSVPPPDHQRLLALAAASAETLRTLAMLQKEDRQARVDAEQALLEQRRLNERLQNEARSRQDAIEARQAASVMQADEALADSVLRIDELEQQLLAKSHALEQLSQRHAALVERQEGQASNYLVEIEALRNRVGHLGTRLQASRLQMRSGLLRHARFARHFAHPLIDGMLLAGTGPNNSPDLIMDAPMITRTNFQPLFAPNPEGVYQLAEFLALHDRSFVRAAYLAILRREPDPDGAENYVNQVRSGEHKAKLLSQFLDSPEARQHRTQIHGLQAHLRIIRLCELPIVGRFLSALFFMATVNSHLRDLRVLENHVIRIAEESQAIHEANMSKLRSIIK